MSTAAEATGKRRSRGILSMITATLRDVRNKKRAANQAQKKKQNKKNKHMSSEETISLSSDSVAEDSSSSSEFTLDAFDTIQRIEQKAQELHHEIVGSLETYTKKEEEVRQAKSFHMERAKGRLEGSNSAGAALSMRKVKQVEREYEHVNDAIQYFSFRKLELDRFLSQIKVAASSIKRAKDLSDTKAFSSLEKQCAQLCGSLTDIASVLMEPSTEVGSDSRELLSELSLLISQTDGSSATLPECEDDSSFYDSDDDDDDSIWEEDEGLLQELSTLMVVEI